MSLLSANAILLTLQQEEYLGWEKENNYLKKELIFSDFKHAMIFVNSLAYLAELEEHHPNITIKFNKVILELFTHSENGITEKDMLMAEKINRI